MTRPYVLLSVAASIDGYIDDTTDERLLVSNDADFDRVDQVRAESDAILIGAETLRRDNPRLLIKSETRRQARVAAGKPANLLKVTVTRTGDIDPGARMFHHGVEAGRPVVYTTPAGAEKIAGALDGIADVVPIGEDRNFWEAVLDDLGDRGIGRLMIEGGSHIHTAILSAGLADELHYAVGPMVVGDPAAPRFLNAGNYPGGSTRRMRLIDVAQIGDVALLRYRPKETQR
ncbi:RibD family protein [Nocardia sp. Marseille-Q1738]